MINLKNQDDISTINHFLEINNTVTKFQLLDKKTPNYILGE